MSEKRKDGAPAQADHGRAAPAGKAGGDTERGWMNPVGPDPILYPDPEPQDPPASGTAPVASEPANIGSGTANVGSDTANVGSGTSKLPKEE